MKPTTYLTQDAVESWAQKICDYTNIVEDLDPNALKQTLEALRELMEKKLEIFKRDGKRVVGIDFDDYANLSNLVNTLFPE